MSVTQTWLKCRNAEFDAEWEQGTGLVTVHGELDAANADQLAEFVARCVKHCQWLTLDLTDLKFVGTAGFSAFHRIDAQCSTVHTRWAMMPSRAVTRLLRICDPDGVLPISESVPRVSPVSEPLLQLIPQPS